MNLPPTIIFDYQPYSHEVLGDLHWDTEKYIDWNNGQQIRERTVLRGTVIEGRETARLLQYSRTRSTAGEPRTIYGVKPSELAAGRIVRVAM